MAAAERYIESALAIYTEVGRQSHIGMCMAELALVLASIGRMQRAIELARRAVAITHAIDGQLMLTLSLDHLGAVLLAAGELEARRVAPCSRLSSGRGITSFPFSSMVAFYYFADLLGCWKAAASNLPVRTSASRLAVTLLSCVRTPRDRPGRHSETRRRRFRRISKACCPPRCSPQRNRRATPHVAELVGIVLAGRRPTVGSLSHHAQ